MTIRYMADSVDGGALVANAVDVPGAGSQLISLTAGYANGTYHDSSQYPSPTDVLIDVDGSVPGADVLDIERGDATPQQSAQWAHDHNAHGSTNFPAILYCNRSTLTQVANVLQANGLRVGIDYKWWISTLDGTTSVSDMTGVVAVQAWGASNFNRNIDLSVVYDDSWKPDKVSTPAPISEDEDMAYLISFPAAPNGNRVAIPVPVSRQVEITLAVDGEATLTEYGWAGTGGNGFSETNVKLGDQGSHSFRPFKGTGKVDLIYTSNADIHGVVDIIG